MTTAQIETFIAMASKSMLREIVTSDSPKWKWYRYAAKRELVRRYL